MVGEPDRTDDGAPATPHIASGRRRARHRAQRSRTRTVLLALLAVSVVAAGLTIGLGTLQVDTVAEDVGRVGDPFPDEQDRPEVPEAAQEALTFLVVGVDPADVVTGGTRAEAALLVRLTGDRRHAQVVTFPLDTWVAEQSTALRAPSAPTVRRAWCVYWRR
jgi:anionic cell wall polymer biosynthesis LytR-Cps2A-Psr (LCP) family protein